MKIKTTRSRCKNIIVKDYLYEGNFIFGTFYEIKDGVTLYILDDGDVFSEQDLIDEDYKYVLITSEEIIEKLKFKFKELKK